MKKFFYSQNGQKNGPISASQLRELADRGHLSSDAIVEEQGTGRKRSAGKIKGLFKANVRQPRGPSPDNSHANKQPPGPQPQFKSPISALLNQLAASVLELMNEKVQKGELDKSQFERRATEILVCLDASIQQAESQFLQLGMIATKSGLPKQRKDTKDFSAAKDGNADNGNSTSSAPKQDQKSGRRKTELVQGRESSQNTRQMSAAPPTSGQISNPQAHSGVGATLKYGAAALAGGAFGYLFANQGRVPGRHGFGPNYGYGGYGETHIHYHGDASAEDLRDDSTEYVDYTESNHHEDVSANDVAVIGADTNDDGLADTFYADTNNDGVADAIGKDTDFDGRLDEVSVDTDGDGTMDETFVSVDEEDGYEEDGYEEDGYEEDGYEEDGYEDIAAVDVDADIGDDMDMDMDMDMDFG